MVRDTKGTGLPFIAIRNSEKGWTQLSDEKGNFSLQVQKEDILVFSGSGLESRSLRIQNGSDLLVVLDKKDEIGLIEETGSRTLINGVGEMKELDSLYANDIIISRDIQLPDSLTGFSVYPEKITSGGMVNLGIQLIPDGEYTLSVIDEEGKEWSSEKICIRSKDKIFSFRVSKLPAGHYYLLLNFSKGKYLKQKLIICK